MKKQIQAILITILLTAVIKINAQTTESTPSPTFEQTVNYIITNTKGRVMYPGALDAYSRVKGYTLKDVTIEKNGKVVFITEQKNDYNDFTITFNIFDLVATTEYPEGVIAKNFLVHFNGLNVSNGYGIVYATQNDALKVARAFRHLRTVCEKPQNDLFSQPVIEEKKTLSKEETIKYINNNILPGLWLGDCKCYELEYYGGNGGKRSKQSGQSSYYVKSHELLSQAIYKVYATSNREDCQQRPYFNYSNDLVKGDWIKNSIEAKFKFDMLELSDFEIIDITNDDKTKTLRLIFKPNTCSAENLSNVDLSSVGIWTPNSLQFRVLSENVEKVKKAFIHLQKLLIEEKKQAEEEDPFGN
jgi:hypothetical protein